MALLLRRFTERPPNARRRPSFRDSARSMHSWSVTAIAVPLGLAAQFPRALLAQAQEIELASGPSLAYIVLKVVVALAVTAGVAFLVVRLMRRFVGATASGDLNGEVRLIGTVGLAPKKQIYLIRCFDRLLVVGSTDSQLTLLSEVTNPELIDSLDRPQPKGRTIRLKGSVLKGLTLQ